MPSEDKKKSAHRALVERVLSGKGSASPEERARAFHNAGVPLSLHALINKVAANPTQVTDADFAAATAAGFSEDQLFELVISAAVGRSARLYDTGLAALTEAIGLEETE
ncbi:hypothetical protein [Nocardia sp. NBC_01388]|uniref:hypothetical protein n=1 Tax=Nocardia sp. NBC_01388 TaxID=2903596 RepID=UPI0032470047